MGRNRQELRLSKTLLIVPQGRSLLCVDYLAKTAASCAPETLYWLGCFQHWTSPATIIRRHPHLDAQSLRAAVADLTRQGLLIRRGTPAAKRQERLQQRWKFGLAAAILHFTCENSTFMALAEATAEQQKQLARNRGPALTWRSRHSNPEAFEPQAAPLLALMARRRSCRTPALTGISRAALVTCLAAGLAITGFTHNGVAELPLKMTPSGGARNPFDAFVLARRVSGLAPGLYRFSGLDGTLSRVAQSRSFSPVAALAGQDWGAEMPALIFLVAFLERSMWKYREANAYRVMLIEAGHITQNMMLAAAQLGLATCPTAALDHALIGRHLKLDDVTETPVYALALCHPGACDDPFTDNPHLPPGLRTIASQAKATPSVLESVARETGESQ